MGHMGFLSVIHLWILVRKGMFMDEKFGHNYLGLFGNILRGKGSSHVEASHLICFANQLTGFYMMEVSVGRCF